MMPGISAVCSPERLSPVPLVERRRAGEVFPRVPVGTVELTREQMAVAFFRRMAMLSPVPGDNALADALGTALGQFGVAGLDAGLRDLERASSGDRAVMMAWAYAYRLCINWWYCDATSRPIPQDAMAAALYVSDLPTDADIGLHDRTSDVDGYVRQGASRLGLDAVMRLGAGMESELGAPWLRRPVSTRGAEYLEVMPDRARREACFEAATMRASSGPRPLLVEFTGGRRALGCTPPELPSNAELSGRLAARAAWVRAQRQSQGGTAEVAQ